jgi:hypothetical protein
MNNDSITHNHKLCQPKRRDTIPLWKSAHAALKGAPFSLKHFVPLAHHLITSETTGDHPFARTLEYVKKNKLPKAKTLKWLKEHKLSSDEELIAFVIHPITSRWVDLAKSRFPDLTAEDEPSNASGVV